MRSQPQVLGDASRREYHALVRHHHALRVPRRAGRVDQCREVERDRRRCSRVTGGSRRRGSSKSSMPSSASGACAADRSLDARRRSRAHGSRRGRCLPSVTTKRARRCPSRMYASLSSFVCGFTTTKTPPASSVPKMETTQVRRVVREHDDAVAALDARALGARSRSRAPCRGAPRRRDRCPSTTSASFAGVSLGRLEQAVVEEAPLAHVSWLRAASDRLVGETVRHSSLRRRRASALRGRRGRAGRRSGRGGA